MNLSDHPKVKPFLVEATCTHCNGEKRRSYDLGGKTRTYDCLSCGQRGTFPGVDIDAILAAICSKRTNAAGIRTFRRSWPSKQSPWRTDDPQVKRAYYVWRLARFHGGADVTMPVTASCAINGDPHRDLLDFLATLVAKRVFGTDRAAMYRWGNLLGIVSEQPPEGLPESAYEGGAVVTSGVKPGFEAMELK